MFGTYLTHIWRYYLLQSCCMTSLYTPREAPSRPSLQTKALTCQRTSCGAMATPKPDKSDMLLHTGHSFSKKLVRKSLEGRILQDADRLAALGAIGIARTFSVGGSENKAFYDIDDPFCRTDRALNDKQWTLDDFQLKLLKLEDFMHTSTAKKIARERTRFMMLIIRQFQREI
jgi:HD superfamily phosphodiesterase